jgi:hypothetical protein
MLPWKKLLFPEPLRPTKQRENLVNNCGNTSLTHQAAELPH